jgi:hypothetical protein
VGVGAVVDHPARVPREGSDDVPPALVSGRQHVHQRAEDLQRLAVGLPLLRLAHGVAQHLDRLVVAPRGGAHVVRGGLAQPAGGQQAAPHRAVQQPPARPADLLVDRVLHQRVRDLVHQVGATLVLGHQAGADQRLQRPGDGLRRLAGQAHQAAQLHPAAEHRQQLQQLDGGRLQRADPAGHPRRQLLRQ